MRFETTAPTGQGLPCLELRGVAKGYCARDGGAVPVLRDVNLTIRPGEFLCIVGYSGSGKTTLISLLAGLTRPDAGEALAHGKPIRGPALDRGMVFQNYSLLPWLTAAGNVALAVQKRFPDLSRAQCAARVRHYLELVNLGHAAERRPHQLSGGMRQRVAVARALALEPEILLLDEPLSALDALTRATLQDEIADLWRRERKTVVLITNDVDEALLLGDRIVPLTPGPHATLGPAVTVPLSRPRVRESLPHDPIARRLRREIFSFLTEASAAATAQSEITPLPKVQPMMLPRRIVA